MGCNAKLSSALLGYGHNSGNDCGRGVFDAFETVAKMDDGDNGPILENFHISAIGLSLVFREDDRARRLLGGFAGRIDRYHDPESVEPARKSMRWDANFAILLLRAASVGLPLTSREARQIQTAFGRDRQVRGVENWDLWDPSIGDGTYGGDGMTLPSEGRSCATKTSGRSSVLRLAARNRPVYLRRLRVPPTGEMGYVDVGAFPATGRAAPR